MPICLRPATMNESFALEQLIAASVRALSLGYYTSEQIESALTHVFGIDTQLIADGTYFVAETAGQLAGCGGWSKRKTLFGGDRMKTGEDALLAPTYEPARIRAFFVHPDFARQGVGKRLIAACEQAAMAAGFRQIELAATLPGEPLYAAVGYEVLERWEHSLPNGITMPLVRMRKNLR